MKTLIIYDSFFGNTEQIARIIGQTVGSPEQVEIVRAGQVTPGQLAGVSLLIVGSPTRGFRPSEAVTKFLNGLANGRLNGVRVAAFDTRVSVGDVNNRLLTAMVKIFGYAAEPIAKKLVKKGGVQAAPPAGFFVKGTEGPLKDGERERAAEWAKTLAGAM